MQDNSIRVRIKIRIRRGLKLEPIEKFLTNERFFFREFKESDWVDVHKYASQDKVCQYQVWGPNTEKESQAFVKQVIVDAAKNPRTRYMFAIVLKEQERMIGAGEINIRDFNNKRGEIA